MPLDDDLIDSASATELENQAGATPSELAEAGHQSARQSRFISRVLSPAVGLWVRSQLEYVEDLQISIEAGDRQLLSGGINRVIASASKAVYRGLHFSQIQVAGQEIQTNLGQLLRGKPFRLLAAFPVTGEVTLSAADLNASLNAPLLADAVTDFLLSLLQPNAQPSADPPTSTTLRQVEVQFGANDLTLTGVLITPTAETAIAVRTGLSIKKGNLLKLEGFQHCASVDELVPIHESKTNVTIPLGADVHLETLSIQAEHLICRGQIMVLPGES